MIFRELSLDCKSGPNVLKCDSNWRPLPTTSTIVVLDATTPDSKISLRPKDSGNDAPFIFVVYISQLSTH